MPSPMPIAPTSSANCSGEGNMWGRGDCRSLTVSMSKRTAPGMWAARYSAPASRFMVGRYQDPSTTTMSGAERRSASQAVDTKGACGIRFSSGQSDPDTPVLLALLLDVGDANGPDLARPTHMGAAAGLQIDAVDLDKPDPAGSAGRLHRHGLHEARIGIEFLIGDPAFPDWRIARDESVKRVGDLG